MGARVDCIVVNDLQDNTFYANIIFNINWMQVEIDARPSDAIAVALRAGAPIYVRRAVLDKAGIPGVSIIMCHVALSSRLSM